MKRLLCLFMCLGLLVLCLPSQSEAQLRFGFRAYGGLNMLDGGDLNVGAEGWFDLFAYVFGLFGATTSGTFSPAKLGMNFGGDVLLMFNPNMGVGFGAGMLSASKETVQEIPIISEDITYSVKASAIPLRLGFYYFLPSSGNMNVYFNAGLGYYLAKAFFGWYPSFSGDDLYDASGSGLGFHGGLGLEYALSQQFGIFAELMGRFASFAGFEGENTNGYTYKGTLYYVEMDLAGRSFPLIYIDDTKPSGPGLSNVREAKVSFTGFSFVVGFFVRL